MRTTNLSVCKASATLPFEPIPVVHLVTNVNVGGLEHMVLQLVRHGNRSRFRTHVICLESPGALASTFEKNGVSVEGLGRSHLGFGSRVAVLARRLRALNSKVVHTHNPGPHVHGAVAAVLARVPVVIHTKHGRNYPDREFRVAINRFASWFTDWVVPVSADAADVAMHVEGVPASKIKMIHNGVELPPHVSIEARSPLRAVVVARLHPVKDHVTLIQAVRFVVDVEPAFRLDVVGDGPCRSELETLTSQLRLTEYVRFLGERNDVQGILSEAGLFVLSSVSEGISLTVLEAMAASLPVVATEVGGTPEIVQDGRTGALVRPRDARAFATAILGIIRDPQNGQRMGREGRRIVEAHFDVSKVVESYERLYLTSLRLARAPHIGKLGAEMVDENALAS